MAMEAVRGNVYTSPGVFREGMMPSQQKPNQQVRPELPRSISTTNLDTTSRCRSVIQNDFKATAPLGGTNYFATTPGFTLILPDMNDYPSDFREFVFNRIVAKDTQESMEKEYCLNWCPNVTKLVPLYTMGDGNCLLHAASLAMWGFQDRDLVLRRAISHAVNDNIRNNTLFQRWQHYRKIENQEMYGCELEPHQWEQEWQQVKRQTSATALGGQNLESLDEFHAFVLANVLRRPIIMYAVPKMRSHQTGGTLQKINFHGVYLPLLWAPDSCKKDPLPLAYRPGHFSALVVVESAQQYRDGHLLLPLSDYYSQPLPVRFILPVEDENTMMMDYLNLVHVPAGGSPYFSRGSIVCAKLTISDVPSYLKPLISGFIDACYEAYIAQKQQSHYPIEGSKSAGGKERPQCINNCGMYGDPATGLCSKCHQKAIGAAEAQEKAASDDKIPQQPQGQFQQHAYEQSFQPNFAVGDQQNAMSSGAIKCPRCSNPGHPSFLGMCERCYTSTSTKQNVPVGSEQQWSPPRNQQAKDPVYEVLPNFQTASPPVHSQQPPAVPPPRNPSGEPVERSQCRTPGCEFFGTKETRFYCSKCFESNMDNILKEVDVPDNFNQPGVPLQPRNPPPTGDAIKQPSVHPPLSSTAHLTPALGLPQPVQEPPKCYKCNEFFASDEYSGMCHSCFMKMTQAENQQQSQFGRAQMEPKYNPQAVKPAPLFYENSVQQNCNSMHCTNPATENGYCEYCNTAKPGSSTYYTQQVEPVSPTRPIPKPRRTKSALQNQPYYDPAHASNTTGGPAGTTTPVVNLANSIADIALADRECFLCTGSTITVNNFVCERHARIMQQLSGDDVRSKPKFPPNEQRSASPYEQPQPFRAHPLGQSNQSASSHGVYTSVKKDIPFGVPLTSGQQVYDAGRTLSAVGREVQQPMPVISSEYKPGFAANHTVYPQATRSRQETEPPSRLNNFGPQAVDPTSQAAAAYGGHHVSVAAGVTSVAGGAGNPQLLPKTLCATPGCSFKGYEELMKLCPDCYQEKYKKSPSPNFPLV